MINYRHPIEKTTLVRFLQSLLTSPSDSNQLEWTEMTTEIWSDEEKDSLTQILSSKMKETTVQFWTKTTICQMNCKNEHQMQHSMRFLMLWSSNSFDFASKIAITEIFQYYLSHWNALWQLQTTEIENNLSLSICRWNYFLCGIHFVAAVLKAFWRGCMCLSSSGWHFVKCCSWLPMTTRWCVVLKLISFCGNTKVWRRRVASSFKAPNDSFLLSQTNTTGVLGSECVLLHSNLLSLTYYLSSRGGEVWRYLPPVCVCRISQKHCTPTKYPPG